MSDTKLVSPLLDGFVMGEALSKHDGVHCYPAMKENSDNRYIVKTIAVPASQKQLEALLLTGACKDPAEATEYFREMAEGIVAEAELLKQLSSLEGFLSYDSWQIAPMEEGKLGYTVYLLGPYKQSLDKFLKRNPMTHLGAINLGLDLCSALAICRRSGHIFIDLRPGNIFLTGEQEYRIGDLGFAKLDSLKYSSMPAKYCSSYTAPELLDPLSTLNPTADIYSVGLILYQIYNDGQLPKADQELVPPANADYELAEIILKACAKNPRNRYQTPIEMGQALVSYMQRNVVNNDPILPPMSFPIVTDEPLTAEEAADSSVPSDEDTSDMTEQDLSEEAGAIVQSAEKLMEEPAVESPSEEEEEAADEEDEEEVEPIEEDNDDDEDEDEDDEDGFIAPIQKPAPVQKPVRNRKPRTRKGLIKRFFKRLFNTILILAILAGVCYGGYYYYTNNYLQIIDEMNIDGDENSITVEISTSIDETQLTAVCIDMYGNTRSDSINGGIAHFSDLNSGAMYTITLEIEGFHKLKGATMVTYETRELTTISDFTAKTGKEDGSVVLSFSVDGPESQDWVINYFTEGEETQSVSFTGHVVTITGLNVDTMYTFQLVPVTELYLVGNDTLEFTASKTVLAENLVITSLTDTTLTAQWTAPADSTVESWTVHCYSDTGYDATIVVDDTNATFTEIFGDQSYTVEVTAAGMSQSTRTYISARAITITNISVTQDEGLAVKWDYVGTTPEGGWLLMYDVDGAEAYEVVKCSTTTGTILNAIPKSSYNISIQAADGSTVFGGTYTYTCPAADDFDKYSLSASYIDVYLGKTPEGEDWDYKNVEKANIFTSGEEVTMVLNATKKFYTEAENVEITFVIRNAQGKAQAELTNAYTKVWQKMWSNYYATLNIPAMPTAEGNYTVELYFNGDFVSSNNFTISK